MTSPEGKPIERRQGMELDPSRKIFNDFGNSYADLAIFLQMYPRYTEGEQDKKFAEELRKPLLKYRDYLEVVRARDRQRTGQPVEQKSRDTSTVEIMVRKSDEDLVDRIDKQLEICERKRVLCLRYYELGLIEKKHYGEISGEAKKAFKKAKEDLQIELETLDEIVKG